MSACGETMVIAGFGIALGTVVLLSILRHVLPHLLKE